MTQKKVKIILLLTCIFFCNTFFVGKTYSNEMSFIVEKCYIDNDYVLLYKIINWWNDNQESGNNMICGNSLKCESRGISQIQYNANDQLLTIVNSSDLEDLISVFKACKGCFGPSYFENIYLNDKYFKTNLPLRGSYLTSTINNIYIQNVTKEEAIQIRNIEDNIVVVLEGVIGGLQKGDSKIALHKSGDFLKSCPSSTQSQILKHQIFLTIKNTITNEVIAKYSAVYNDI